MREKITFSPREKVEKVRRSGTIRRFVPEVGILNSSVAQYIRKLQKYSLFPEKVEKVGLTMT
jgi:hypothetical protein